MIVPVLNHPPMVKNFAPYFRDIFANQPEFVHFQNYLTGLVVAERKNFSQISRCLITGADYTNIDRFMNNPLWDGIKFNTRRVELHYRQTLKVDPRKVAAFILDDTLDEHVGSLFEHISRHYDHCDNSYKLARNPVTSHYQRGEVSFPVDFRTYRTYDEATNWEAHLKQNFPELEIPKKSKERNKLKQKYEKKLLALDAEFARKHEVFKTKIKLAVELVEDAIERGLDFEVVLFDAWYLSPELVEVIERHQKAWISQLKSNRKIETRGLKLNDAEGNRIKFEEAEIRVDELVKLIPKSAYRKVERGEQASYWAFSLTVQIKTLGKVRLVVSWVDEKCEESYAVLVTRQIHWEAKRIITTYCERFSIEVFYKDAKQQLGFSDYQCRSEQTIGKHWYLVFCAYSLLRLDMLQTPAYQTWQRKLKTISVAVKRQAQWVIEELILTSHKILSQAENPADLFKFLFGESVYAT